MWRSLVARIVRDDEAAGSNPVIPTIYFSEKRPAAWRVFFCLWHREDIIMTAAAESCAKALIDFIGASPSPYHAAQNPNPAWEQITRDTIAHICPGRTFYLPLFRTGAVIVSVGKNPRGLLRMACAHTDFPCLRIKPNPMMCDHGYGRLNVEVYGGMIRNTWLDRPLSIAGAVTLRGAHPFAPELRLVDFRRPLVTIPNLAIHMNRKVNEGVELKPQKDLLPLFFQADTEGDMSNDAKKLNAILAELLGVGEEEILSYDLNLYPVEYGCLLGAGEEFLSAPRLDNLSSVKACFDAVGEVPAEGISVVALFDNEEVGSRTKQGAGSLALSMMLERVYTALGCSRDEYLRSALGGLCLSVDVAHALHPNAPEKADPTNRPQLNGGVVLKVASSQSYACDPEAFAAVKDICLREDIPHQVFTNHSDAPGGATLGSILSTLLPMRTMDIGVPILGMHSARETMGRDDQYALTRLLTSFFRLEMGHGRTNVL